MSFKGQSVWVNVDDGGRPVLDSQGRAEMKYRESDSRSYRPAPQNLLPSDAPAEPAHSPRRPTDGPARKFPSHASGDTVHVWTDGACSGNPGPMGIGVVVVAGDKRKEHGEYLGRGTNNIAELTAIRRGLEIASELVPAGDRPIRVYSDSSYAIGLLSQGWKAKANQELEASCLQSCDDLEATYRKKGVRTYQGYVANLSETCDPENEVQLITKVQVAPNNTNDNSLLLEALPDLKDRTGLETLYTDGPYAGPDVDQALQKHQVEQIQTGITGKILDPNKLYLADFEIGQDELGVPTHLTCPQGQSVPVELSRRGRSYQADFDPTVCLTCPFHLAESCPAQPGKKRASFRLRFTSDQMAVAHRRRKMRQSKLEGKNPRSAIEGTVREVKHPFPAGKLPVRGLFRMTCLMVTSAAMTNVRRIHHYWEDKRKQARQKMAAEQGPNAAPQQQDLSFASFLKALLTSRRAFTARPNAYLGF